ncbi:MAG: RNA ligase family protein [Candidatus Contendobacter sp.]|nr:RNA ligase family protein [Candidatus Contendobacter sp.]MDG4558160.1 RNA ligase family protein [Candidatus Contendobacter sp.]
MSDFHRFPHTPHLAWLGKGEPRDDKVLSKEEADALLSAPVRVEEKIDGANLGLSVGPDGRLRAQNRGQYLEAPCRGQFTRLAAWLAAREIELASALGQNLVLFGEWCAARHSVEYEQLPDWFVAFDVYGRESGRFWSAARRDEFCARLGLAVAPALSEGRTSLTALRELVTTRRSRFGDGLIEGVVVRRDQGDWLGNRAKLVAPGFTQAISEHWRRRALTWNRLATQGTALA